MRAHLYFDSNVYARIEEEGSAPAVKDWLGNNQLRLPVSEGLMTEAFRIGDAERRRRRFEVITNLATDFPQPWSFSSLRELVAAAKRHRPGWLRSDPDLELVSKFLNLDRNTWRRLKADPAYFPPELAQSLQVVHEAVGEVRHGQRATRNRLLEAAEAPATTLRTELAEAHWRTTAAVQLISALFPEKARERFSVLYFAYFDRSQMEPRELASFFQQEVDGDELPRSRVLGMTDYFQRRYEVTAGNWMDQGHSTELLNVDVLVTRDRAFHSILSDLTGALPVRGRSVLLTGAKPIPDQLLAIDPQAMASRTTASVASAQLADGGNR